MSRPTAVVYAGALAHRGGTGVYLRRLLSGFDSLGTDGVLAALDGRLVPPAEAISGDFRRFSGWRKVLAEHVGLPRLAASVSPGMVHLPAFGGRPPADTPFAVTLHDAAFLANPGWFPPVRSLYYRLAFRRTAQAADRVLVDSDFTGREAERLLGLPRERIRRVYLATVPFRSDPEPFAAWSGLTGAYAVFVGTVEPRKNPGALLDAWRLVRVRYPALSLVVAGRWGWGSRRLRNRLEREPGVLWTGGIPEPMLRSCVSGARLLVYPSLYEGFGLPPLEAASAGVPSVVSPAGALEEVYGGIARVADGFDPASIASAVTASLETPADPEMLMSFAAGFTRESLAENTLDVYRELAP